MQNVLSAKAPVNDGSIRLAINVGLFVIKTNGKAYTKINRGCQTAGCQYVPCCFLPQQPFYNRRSCPC